MNPELRCPECGGAALKVHKRVYRLMNKTWQGVTCQNAACGYHWGVETSKLQEPEPVEPVVIADDGGSAPVGELELVEVGKGFELDAIAEGDQLLVDYRGDPKRITVCGVSRKSVVAEIDGDPDIRIRHPQILGRFQ